MAINKNIIIHFFHYFWIALGLGLILFIISQAIYTKRSLEYMLDFSQPLTQNIVGWQPENRVVNLSSGSLDNVFSLAGEPVYMKIYIPIDFSQLTISGGIYTSGSSNINLGLRQKDGSWKFKKVDLFDQSFSSTFDLAGAQTKNNQLEIILSVPDLNNTSTVSLVNNWSVILSR